MSRDTLAILAMCGYHVGAHLGPAHGVAAILTAYLLTWVNERWLTK